jgi:hypothetical protein
MRTNWLFAWTIGAVLPGATSMGVTTASGQKAAGNPHGGNQWLAAMDTDHDGSRSKQEFTAYAALTYKRRNLLGGRVRDLHVRE